MKRALKVRRRGQALVEYSILTYFLAITIIIASTSKCSWGGPQPNQTALGMMFDAYQVYNDSYYFFLCAPLP